MRNPCYSVALALVVTSLLAGCGTPGQLGLAPTAADAPSLPTEVALSPSVGLVPVVRVAELAPVTQANEATPIEATVDEDAIRIVGESEITREELEADADDAGYQIQASVSVPSAKGIVRRTSGDYFMLECERDTAGTKRQVNYVLHTPDLTTRLWLGDHINKRVHVKGIFYAAGIITVSFAESALDLGFLTNWWTKGKIKGRIVGRNQLPIGNAEVKARSREGFVYLGNTDDTGEFSVKNLTPGWYQIWFSKVRYGVISRMVYVDAHKALQVEGTLSQIY